MSNTNSNDWEDFRPGIKRRLVADGERLMGLQFQLTKGAVVTRHNHMHEQVSFVHSGALRFEFDDRSLDVRAGQTAFMPAYAFHQVTALEDTFVFEVFSPPREDFRATR
jgi:quercetin dioxygenase-like cupin family protein